LNGGNWDDERACNVIGLTVIEDGPLLNQTVELHDRSLTISGTFAATALGPRYAIHPERAHVAEPDAIIAKGCCA
jgi:hypothetical protein